MSNREKYVRSFNELASDDEGSAGGKGAMLARLCQAGYPVPDGFIILTGAFEGDKLKALCNIVAVR